MKKGTVYYDSKGPSGNIYHILGLVRQEMRKQRRISEFNECRDKVFDSQSYEDALAVINEYVNLVDTSKTNASQNTKKSKRTNADLEDDFQQAMATDLTETEMTYVGDIVFEGGTDYEIRAILATQNGGLEESELTLVEALNLEDDSTAYLIILDGEVENIEGNKTAAEDFYKSFFEDMDNFFDDFDSFGNDSEDLPYVEDDEYYETKDATYDGTSMVGALDDEIEELYDEETKKAVNFERRKASKGHKIKASVGWDYFYKFDTISDKYMPERGQGDTRASQIVTAVNKLIYKWYNDGDVFDNTYHLEGWANDLSSYANWLSYNTDGRAYGILQSIKRIKSGQEYTDLLKRLADALLDPQYLSQEDKEQAVGDIYDCEGPFMFREDDEEDDEEDDDGVYGSRRKTSKHMIKAAYSENDAKKLLEEVKKWVEKCFGYETIIYCLGRSYELFAKDNPNFDSEKDGSEVFVLKWEEKPSKDPSDYFEYVREPNILSMSFEGPVYDIINHPADSDEVALEAELDNILKKYGLYYELGHAWNLTCYPIDEYDWQGFDKKRKKVTSSKRKLDPKGDVQKALSKLKPMMGKELAETKKVLEKEGFKILEEEKTYGNWVKGNDVFAYLEWREGKVTYIDLVYSDDELGVLYEEESGSVHASAQTDATYKVGDAIEYEKTLAFEKGAQKIKSKIVAINGMRGLTAEGDWISILKDLPIRILSSIRGDDNAKIMGREAMEKLEESGIEGADILLDEVGTKTYVDWCTYLLDTYVELGEDLVAMGENKQAEENTKTVIAPLKKHISQVSASKTTKNNIQTESADNAPTDGVYNPGDLVFWKEEWKDSGDDKYNFIVVEDSGDRFTYTADPKDQSKRLSIPGKSVALKDMVARRITNTKILSSFKTKGKTIRSASSSKSILHDVAAEIGKRRNK